MFIEHSTGGHSTVMYIFNWKI